MTPVKDRLREKSAPLSCYLNLIPSAVATQAIAAAGADIVIIDQEHGPIGPESVHAMVAATAGTSCSPWVRVPLAQADHVKTALDAGAEGIVFPLVRTAQDAAECVALTRYPPKGKRGWGPFVAHARWGTPLFEHLAHRGDSTVCCLLMETVAAVENAEAICKVEGIDCMVIAPFDLSTELGVSGRMDAPQLREAVQHLEKTVLAAGIPLGGAAMTREQSLAMRARGYTLMAHHFDVLVLGQFVRESRSWLAGP
ncbi:HpcH/HpaI aldolase family protein [Ramlibacter albus]|uniref:2,4-dihydroxyhept-2-ene-1,7-dioic acid aldolase n=1 Tax=Ramlibacter albus TaxID=2079448 RepID=A0A923MD57_9BURK|nr:aldolase/citrate lyase family protein [Ramlibacter albus]MBC5768567.1 2,4-dihydroxyhept-2-ene-1,7-dioic acid aldolase [Ramlibacter albus]